MDQSAHPVNLQQALARFDDHWSPRIIAAVNNQHVKLAKLSGPFHWHAHAEVDELFLVLEGRLIMELRDRRILLEAGELFVVPRGVEHRPVADPECAVLLVETAGLINTGDGEQTEQSTAGTWLS